MNDSYTTVVDVRIVVAYMVLVLIYLLILKLLLNAIQSLTHGYRTQRSIIDLEIHRQSPSDRIEDSMRDMNVFQGTVALLRVLVAFVGLVGVMALLIIKLNFFVAVLIAGVSSLVAWQFVQWRRRGKANARLEQYFEAFLSGGGNVVTIGLLIVALVCVTVGLLLLP